MVETKGSGGPKGLETELTAMRLVEKVLKSKNEMFSETIQIKPDGNLQTRNDKGENISDFATSAISTIGSDNSVALYQFAHDIQERHPDLLFTFQRNKDGKSISYGVILAKTSEQPKGKSVDPYKQWVRAITRPA